MRIFNKNSEKFELSLVSAKTLIGCSIEDLKKLTVTKLVEPITFTVIALWVLEKIASGIVSEMGAEFYRKVTGQTNQMEVAIRKMAVEIRNYIDFVIQQNEIKELSQLAEIVKNLHTDYINAPSLDRLEQTTTKIEELLVCSKNDQMDFPNASIRTHELFIGAVCLKLIILRERERQYPHNQRGEKLNALALIDAAKIHLDRVMDHFLKIVEARLQQDQDFDRMFVCLKHASSILSSGDTIYGYLDRYAAVLRQELEATLAVSGDETIHPVSPKM